MDKFSLACSSTMMMQLRSIKRNKGNKKKMKTKRVSKTLNNNNNNNTLKKRMYRMISRKQMDMLRKIKNIIKIAFQ